MARRKKKRKNDAKGFWGISPFAFTTLVGFGLLVLISAFLLGEVFLFIRNPKGEVAVPDFVGMDFSNAESAATRAKLNLNINKFIFSDKIEKDYITDQEPTPGVKVKEGRTIYLTVSKGRRDIETPNLLGMHIDEAKVKLQNLGLVVAEPQMRYNEKAAPGRIINQSPPPGTPIARGEKVLTIVSKGPELKKLEMPDVEGMSLEEAMAALEQAGLRVSRITRIYSATARGERITGQAPVPGRSVKRGSEVILTLTVPSYKRTLGERQFRVVVNVPASEDGIEVSIVKNDLNETKRVYLEVIKGPATLEKLVEAYGSTTISIYFDGNLYREETF
jgi:serine/threonine-protein kinase